MTNGNANWPSVFTVGDSNSTTFSGSITESGPTGTLSLAKVGTGALNLDPAAVLTLALKTGIGFLAQRHKGAKGRALRTESGCQTVQPMGE
jgi:hypothetical protein